MPRAHAILQSEFPYHITARSINREWFQLPLQFVWEIFCTELNAIVLEENLKVHSFVLMNNHFHLIASTPDANISRCMMIFLKRCSSRLTRAGNRINETFAGRHYKCVLSHPNHYLNAYKYNYRNPVDAGICAGVEDYPFSTLGFVMRPSTKLFPMAEDTTYLFSPEATLKWLNTPPEQKKFVAVRNALRRPQFKVSKCRSTRRSLMTNDELL